MNNNIDTRTRISKKPSSAQYKRRRHPKKRSRFPFLFFLIILAFFGACYLAQHEELFQKVVPNSNPIDLNFNFSPRRQNILLMGVDVASNTANPFKGNRSDTMLLISVAPYGKNINIISIPRDSKVYIAGKGKADKINHAFAFGGARLAVKTVEETFGVKINNYVAISNAGVIKMIDVLGGLPIYVEKNMKYDDYSAGLHINLKQGNQVLSGKEVEGYLRFRHDSYGDIGRIRRQQWFQNAMLDRLKDPSVIVKLPELLKIMPEYIQTDMSGYELAKYASIAKAVDKSTVQVATVPGAPSTKGIISYWIIDPEKTQDLINKMIYRNYSDVEIKDLSIGILYSQEKEGTAYNLKEQLVEHGIEEVKAQSSKAASKNYIAIHNLDIAGDTINELKKIIPDIKDFHTIYDPIGINRTAKDLTIVVAN